MQGLVQAMQTQAHTQAALQAQLEAQERADVWWSSLLRTLFEDGAVEALSAVCRQEGEMEQYLEEKKASQKRPAAPFQRQERKKVAFQSPQRPVASGSGQLAGKCLKCGSSEHRIKDCPRLQRGVQRGPAPAVVAAVAPATGRPGRPRAPARVFALAREDAEQADHVTEAQLSIRSSVLDEVIEHQKADPRLQELVGKAGITRDEN
ncbi:hypothetical protein Taro_015868, partial [Colocasia esculenta]|nr:hypothetical protein [Colocasia esculenta]